MSLSSQICLRGASRYGLPRRAGLRRGGGGEEGTGECGGRLRVGGDVIKLLLKLLQPRWTEYRTASDSENVEKNTKKQKNALIPGLCCHM